MELCPICIEDRGEYYTECGHNYCIKCLSKIKKCAICRKQLVRTNLCIQIKSFNRIGFLYLTHRRRYPAYYYHANRNNVMSITSLNYIGGMSGLAYSN
jgi:hypothetical protein